MAQILDEDSMEALITARTVVSDCGYWSDLATSSLSSISTSELNRCSVSESSASDYSSLGGSPARRVVHSSSAGNISSLGASSAARRRRKKNQIMDDADKGIYNSLGSSSSSYGKLTYSQLGLNRGWKKRGAMWKTGPNPSWFTRWKKRFFILKGNFLYYFAPHRNMDDAPVLGAIYLRNAIIKKDSISLAKKVLKILPSVPRRMGWKDANDESSIFYLKFQSESDRQEWYEELQQVSFENQFPAEKGPIITSSMEFTMSYLTSSRS